MFRDEKNTWKNIPLCIKCIFFTEADPYCVIKCEGQKVKTAVMKNSQDPEWNASFIFYRHKPQVKPILVTLWNSNLTLDSFIGQVQVSTLDPFEELSLDLKGRRSKKDEKVCGQIKLMVENFHNLDQV